MNVDIPFDERRLRKPPILPHGQVDLGARLAAYQNDERIDLAQGESLIDICLRLSETDWEQGIADVLQTIQNAIEQHKEKGSLEITVSIRKQK